MVESLTPEREVGVRYLHPPCCVLEQRHTSPRKVLVIPRKRLLRSDMTEKLLTWTLSINTIKQTFEINGNILRIPNLVLCLEPYILLNKSLARLNLSTDTKRCFESCKQVRESLNL